MSIQEIVDKASNSAAVWITVTFLGGIVALVRKVSTNQKKVDLLESTLNRDRDEYRRDMAYVKESLAETQRDIKRLFERSGS